MERLRWILPLVTTFLPLVGAKVHALHGAVAGVVALSALAVVDALCWLAGGTKYSVQTGRPVPAGPFYGVLFTIYCVLLPFSFFEFVRGCAAMGPADLAGHVFSWVVILGFSTLTVGHVLIHASSKLSRAAGQGLFSLMNYPHFPMLHVHEHHRHVAMEGDFHSAARNETFYAFFARAFMAEVACPWRPKHRRRSLAPAAAQLVLLVGIWTLAGPRALAIYVLTTFLARVVIALINYVQHYGLRRHAGQKPGIEHSWDLPHKSMSWLYFNAGFHADHHLKASLAPDQVALKGNGYLLPFNVQIIIPLALLPWLFFRAMNPLLASAEAQSEPA